MHCNNDCNNIFRTRTSRYVTTVIIMQAMPVRRAEPVILPSR